MADSSAPRKIGILGCGNIFPRYVEGMQRFSELEIVHVADMDVERAREAAATYGIPAFGVPEGLYEDPAVEIVVNLTPPAFHASTIIAALQAGKHVYVEKPLALSKVDARAVLNYARDAGLTVASAPDTFLGSANQTARRALDDGMIGEPIGATAFVRHSRAETWHPNPGFLFGAGGGPVLDMGPYYVANLVNLLGPVQQVFASTRTGLRRRPVSAPDRAVDFVEVTVPTHASASLSFTSGAVATTVMSFDVWHTELPYMEIYGTEGTLSLPNPNTFDGDVRIKNLNDVEWRTLEPVTEPFGRVGTPDQYMRGLGVADLAGALSGSSLRVNGEFAFHTLEVLGAFQESEDSGAPVNILSTCSRPEPRPAIYSTQYSN